MGSITLTNIPQFIEQPGRDIVKTAGSLDRMTVPFLGPYNVPPPFTKGSPDSVYPLMFCTGFSERDNGALTELTVNYAGRTDASGTFFISEFLQSSGASEKEISYSELASGMVGYYNPGLIGSSIPAAGFTGWYKTCTVNYVLHYISTTVTFKYCCYPTPIPLGIVGEAPAVTSQYVRYAGSSSPTYTFGPMQNIQDQYPGPFGFPFLMIRQSAFSAQELIKGWFECSVTYDARFESQ